MAPLRPNSVQELREPRAALFDLSLRKIADQLVVAVDSGGCRPVFAGLGIEFKTCKGFFARGNCVAGPQRSQLFEIAGRLGKATAFTYDGLGRRVTIASTPPGGGSATTTSYLWCGNTLCQTRNASNATTRSYYGEGEFAPGTPNQPYYYGIDQIGSVRRAFASTSSAPAYSYDAYGVPLQATGPVTDFVYGGMFYNADSGLYLTKYRAYDPVAGRWLSRDPLGERTDPSANLYTYVNGNPVSVIDTSGLLASQLPAQPSPGAPCDDGGYGGSSAPSNPPGSLPGVSSSSPAEDNASNPIQNAGLFDKLAACLIWAACLPNNANPEGEMPPEIPKGMPSQPRVIPLEPPGAPPPKK